MHPIIAALAEGRRRLCPCGAVQQPYRLCRCCRRGHLLEMPDNASEPSRRYAPNARRIPTALFFARALPLLQNIGKGAQG